MACCILLYTICTKARLGYDSDIITDQSKARKDPLARGVIATHESTNQSLWFPYDIIHEAFKTRVFLVFPTFYHNGAYYKVSHSEAEHEIYFCDWS